MPGTGIVLERPLDPAVKLGYVVEPRKLNQILATFDINLVAFNIYGAQIKTIERAERQLYDRQTLLRCYHFLTDDHRLALPFNACRQVVLGEITRIWYEVSGLELPVKFEQRQEARMAKAKATTAEAEAAATEAGATAVKEPRITVKSIIEAGLLAKKSEEDILAEVKSHFPNGKADSKHVGYYRHYLVKDGKLEKQERKPRAKKAGATTEGTQEAENAAPPAKVTAKAGSAKAAAPPASKPAAKAAAKR